jgi:hypothetical protein
VAVPAPPSKNPTVAQRKMFAKMKIAMPDGSYYVRNASDLQNAIDSVGRGENAGDSGAAIRKHIMDRAAKLKLSSKIPDTWNPDGTLKEAAQDGMTVGDLLEHFGVKGMHWGVRNAESRAEEGGSDSGKVDKHAAKKAADHDRLIQAAKDHETAAVGNIKAAQNYNKEQVELRRKGLDSTVAKRVYGDNASKQGNWEFYGKNGMSQNAALTQLDNNLRMVQNQHVRAANHHSHQAVKLREKAEKLTHDGINFDPNFDIDVYLSHFGVKGMHWGVRKERGEPSEDHVRVSELRSKVKTGRGVHVLDNNELQDVITRLNLETSYARLVNGGGSEIDKGEKFIKTNVGRVKTGIDAVETGRRAVKLLNDIKK